MVDLSAAHHETTYHLPQRNIHILLDEDDTVEVIGHQLTAQHLDITGAGGARAH